MKLDEWKLMSKPSRNTTSTSSSLSYADKLKKLLDYQIAKAHHSIGYKIKNPVIDLLTETNDRVHFRFKEELEVPIKRNKVDHREKIIEGSYYKNNKTWDIQVYINGIKEIEESGTDFNNFIRELTKYIEMLPGVPNSLYQDILESALTSIADDFKAYENLWD